MCVSECVCVCSQDWSSDCVGKEGDSCGRRPDIDGDEVEEGAARQVGTNDMRLEGKDGFPKRDRKYNSLKENTVFFHHFFFFCPCSDESFNEGRDLWSRLIRGRSVHQKIKQILYIPALFTRN